MKKLLTLLLALTMTLSLLACGASEEKAEDSSKETTAAPEGTDAPTKPADPTGPVVTPDGKKIYTGPCSGEQIQIILGEDDVASLCIIESTFATAEDLAEMGLTGNLIMSHVQRVELTASVADGVVTLTGSPSKGYESMTVSGTAAEAYKTMAKQQMDAALAGGSISQEEYDQNMAWVNGEETVTELDPDLMTVIAQLNDEDMSCLLTSMESKSKGVNGEERAQLATYEYKDGALYKEINYTSHYANEGTRAWVYCYYPDGVTNQYEEEYYLTYKDGQFTLGALKSRREYHEDGKQKYGVGYYSDGAIHFEELYDENGNETKSTYYKMDGSIEHYTLYEQKDGVYVVTYYNEDDKPTQQWHYSADNRYELQKEIFYEYNEDGSLNYYNVSEENDTTITETLFDANHKPQWTSIYLKTDEGRKEQKEIYYDENGSVLEYYEYTYEGNVETQTHYYANGVLWGVTEREYDENGNVIKMTDYDEEGNIYRIREFEYDPETGRQLKETEYDGNGNITGVYEYGS